MDKAVVLLSGGIDSTTAAYKTWKEGFEIHALTIEYGQRAIAEVEAASRTADKICTTHKILNLGVLADIWKTPLINQDIDPTQNDRDGDSAYVVPLRNIVFLSVACAYAQTIGAVKVVIGNQEGDTSGFPDCTELAMNAMQNTILFASEEGKAVIIDSPWQHTPKADIIAQGLALGVPYKDTYSCYADGPACGKCESCLYRLNAFGANGVHDPIEYAIPLTFFSGV